MKSVPGYEQTAAGTAGVKSASRVLVLLNVLSECAGGATFSELHLRTGYPKGSLHGLLATLAASGWAKFHPDSKTYKLGVRAWEAGIAYTRAAGWEERARETMTRLRDALGETVQLAVLDRMQALYIAKIDGIHSLRLASHVGQRLEAHATGVGKMLLSTLPDPVLEAWWADRELERYTENTITDPALLRGELARIRQAGYANDIEERTAGACCIAVGVSDGFGKIVAALSVSSPSVRFGAEVQSLALLKLREASRELAQKIGNELENISSSLRN